MGRLTVDQYFPIRTKTSCQLKWNWSTIRLYNGHTSSCHRVDSDIVDVETFDQFHNTTKKIQDRELMLQGQWPKGGCEHCEKLEQTGGQSDRQFHLQIPNQTPVELLTDPTAVSVTPRIVEVYFDNVCNMSCIYCWDGFSSKIQQENIQFGSFENRGIVLKNVAKKVVNLEQLTDKFWQWMQQHATKLSRFHVLGGEPFYQKQFDQCLEFFNNVPCPELEFNVISNLMLSNQRFKTCIDSIHKLVVDGKIKRFDLTASIDCWGPEQEYVRYGIDLEQWKRNFDYVATLPWITLNINQTLTALTIKTVPELISHINQYRKHKDIGHYFSTAVMTHDCLSPAIFGPDFFDQDIEDILQAMPNNTWQEQQARANMQAIQLQLKSSNRSLELIQQLVVLLDELDRRRNLNWRLTFPWLKKEANNVV
jgi:organic radical activating enzyme